MASTLRPVSSNGQETNAKQLALSYTFDLWSVFQQCCQGTAALFVPKARGAGGFGSLILVRVLERILS